MMSSCSFTPFDFDDGLIPPPLSCGDGTAPTVDFSDIFDDTDLDELFRSTEVPVTTGGANGVVAGGDPLFMASSSGFTACGGASVVSNPESEHPCSYSSPSTELSSASNDTSSPPSNPFVNIVMIVDPITLQVICPKQVLEYHVNGKIERVVFGPTVLDAMPQDLVSLTNMASYQQQQQQQTIMETPSCFQTAHEDRPLPSPPTQTTFPLPQSTLSQQDPVVQVPQQPPKSGATTTTTVPPIPPLRALSAYNFFFRDERDRILHGGEYEWTTDKQRQLLDAHWNQDRTKKRRHRKSHGKIDFTTLSRLISSRWKELSEDQKEFYRQVAAQDWERFQREVDEYKKPSSLSSTSSSASSVAGSDMEGDLHPVVDTSLTHQFQTVIG